ncbi:hypothetical protein SDC9_156765 [bioreactor metagenome]|uniref:Uncharacterized protein n=1 Tax=bioreactor metagenome TaxID=1076179 RepID=A0A645F548_9ZZZZ
MRPAEADKTEEGLFLLVGSQVVIGFVAHIDIGVKLERQRGWLGVRMFACISSLQVLLYESAVPFLLPQGCHVG